MGRADRSSQRVELSRRTAAAPGVPDPQQLHLDDRAPVLGGEQNASRAPRQDVERSRAQMHPTNQESPALDEVVHLEPRHAAVQQRADAQHPLDGPEQAG